ncbi:hypothetical protein GCM10009760_28610 [Kitasatospora kazusensis]|uniref:Uncharacterized protein n=1 Tax=Kitasatospora kazusensis TaxID=407974 RepID=A0ABP5LAP9_9ACTN
MGHPVDKLRGSGGARGDTDCDPQAGRRAGAMAQARKIGMYLLLIFVIYTIITSPARAAELVQSGFVGISDAAKSVGTFMTGLVK